MNTSEQAPHVTGQTHINRLNPSTGEVESGWEVTVRDPVTGVIVPVFLRDDVYGAEQAKTLIQFELEKVRAVHELKF